ncbi:sodium:solute symporter family protein [Verrucomicrobia bacterium]|jgi:solute:Na+ symporter, SSS family|nr:sodium:solute symporter family protein [Verrucomicrobiota bacterium]MDB4798067.1 sodium:solute symporter family protein [Verrucomicrobiota bacterium]
MTPLIIVVLYLALLLGLGFLSSRKFRGTSRDFFVASHSVGPFLLLMSVFGTTMTAFALVGSTGKSFERGIGIYGLMGSMSGLVHVALFYFIGTRLWAIGKRNGYVTQIQFFRARFNSVRIGYVLFPVLVMLVIPYLLIGIIGAGKTLLSVTAGTFPEIFPNPATPQWAGGIPVWLTGLVVCSVVLSYVFMGGSRGAAWANTFQTLVFMLMGVLAFFFISRSLGGFQQATQMSAQFNDEGFLVQSHRFDPTTRTVLENDPPKVIGRYLGDAADVAGKHPLLARTPTNVELYTTNPATGEEVTFNRQFGVGKWMFFTYLFIPLSAGMFPHLFQHWLTARSAKAFQLTIIGHPLCILVVWVPCVLIGTWATGILPPLESHKVAGVLGSMVAMLVGSPILTGFLTAGILAAIMSSLDSQFLCLGTMFTNDIVLQATGPRRFSDRQIIVIARSFVIGVVGLTYFLSLLAPGNIFDMAVWCFTGFSALVPLVVASLYWRRTTLAGAYASIAVAVVSWFYFFQASGFGGEYAVGPGIVPAAICVTAAAVSLVLVSLVTRPPSDETLVKFFPR